MAGKLKVVISDFHLADGQEEGLLNPWENFHHDRKLAEFLRYYSTDYYEDEDVELIINGDFFDLLQVRYDGAFPLKITEAVGAAKLRAAIDGHPAAMAALGAFARQPNKRITVIPGNHDIELVFPACRALFTEAVCGAPDDPRVRFVVEREYYEFDGVQVHHGMQFEAMNRFQWKRLLIRDRPGDEPYLNLPWGSVFILLVLNKLKEKRPYIDRVQPFSLYLIGALFLDTAFALRLCAMALHAFVITRLIPMLRKPRNVSWRDTLALVGYTAFARFERKARRVLQRNPHVHTVIMGHTHLPEMRRFGRRRTYVNTGTWTDLISLDIARPGLWRDLTYATIEYQDGEPPRTRLRAWRGYHDLWRDIYY